MRRLLFVLVFFSLLAGAQAQDAIAPISEASYGQNGDLRYIQIPLTQPDCMNITATPIIVGDWLVYPAHTRRECGPNSEPFGDILFGYNLQDGQLYSLYRGGSGEAVLTYDEANGVVYWTMTFGGNLTLFDAPAMTERTRVNLGMTADSSATLLNGLAYLGTVNGPSAACQQPINPDCGKMVAVDSAGQVVDSLGMDDGLRAWFGTSPTTDGTYLYWGSAAQTVGEKTGDETEYLYGCSVIKTDAELNILANFDPGDMACYKLSFQGANMDSVSGEVVPDGTGLWVQYVRPNDAEMVSHVYRLDLNLQMQCDFTFPFIARTQAAGFYAGPTVDAAGNAYVAVSVDENGQRRATLARLTPTCERTILAEVPDSIASASPTLADDQYILFATDGLLQVLTFDGQVVQQYNLASSARVMASPVIHNGVVYVLQEDGTLNIIENSGLQGYGNAIWPRYRHDNAGTGQLGAQRLDASAAAPPPSDGGQGPKGAFIAFHLEVSRAPRVRALWPLLEQFMALADRYNAKITLQFSTTWADYVYRSGLLETVHAWENNGHEIALHHHGPTHKFFDGYTNAPDAVRTDGWYGTEGTYLGTIDDLMAFMAPLSQRGITSAGMSDEETDWPAVVLYFATDSGDSPSRDDLLSTPVETVHNGYPVVEIYNAGYEIAHLGDAAVTLADVEAALQRAGADEYLGIVFNDETIESDFALIEPLFELLAQHGVQVETVSVLLSRR